MRTTENRVPLSTGAPIHNYSVVKAISSDDISICYQALSSTSNRLVILNEFFPATLATRHSSFRDINLMDPDKASTLQDSIQNFERVTELLIDCEHPNLHRTIACLAHGGTVLSVHEKVDLPSLAEFTQQRQSPILSEAEIRQLLLPILHGLQQLHSKGILHLGIHPQHILLEELAAPVLTHFCQAQCIGSNSSLAAVLSLESVSAFLAQELLSKKSELTPASDIYALGMMLYYLMTGLELPLAQDRLNAILEHEPDPLPPLLKQTTAYSHSLHNLVEACVALRQKDRPQSVAEVLAKLDKPANSPTTRPASGTEANQPGMAQSKHAKAPQPARTADVQHATETLESPKRTPHLQYGAIATAACLLITVTYVFSKPSSEDQQLLSQHHSMERLAQLETQRLNDIRQLYQLVSIPAGQFSMGCTGIDCPAAEVPARTIEVTAFQMMAHQVTFAMWDACVEQGGCTHRPRDEGWGRSSRPVINVSYEDIVLEFIPWLNQASRQTFRLPSEVEWEYAAKAGSQSAYQFGENIRCEHARFGRRSGGECSTQLDGTSSVMSFEANAFGLHDIHGNVWEWTQDCWNADYQQAAATQEPRLTGNCVRRVQRGGAWLSTPAELTVTYRNSHDAKLRHRNNGFRLLLE
ncbi:SUMF1/EgtB/PvdO family nonheme iron enzyme [Alkalimonas collagenimarina]|uniref:SUMF1/EgtB/PvdO family nonheme iron enzyme n=1 Tax=Alkalimonas collagenimarina TaxID=400390 RepID=A0ABT9GU88_9GAMM|nr:SUMF1/EgtB/PvdO family nonheme iron enzyme [Alkalimonas collagenimarina]MDP4534617.1 SUMF1/EgtB/PvdO family nonheme iron enzyme [Alkalimonas collagenimarina]